MVSVPRESHSIVTETSGTVIAETTHSPINITSESDFISLGLPGDGSPTDPYIIEDLSIESVSGESCVSVSGDISSNYVIRNCIISGTIMGEGDDIAAAGIYLGAGQGIIDGCRISDCEIGVGIEYIEDVMIQNNIIETTYRGVAILNSSNVVIEDCELRGGNGLSLRLVNVSDALVSNCIIDADYTIIHGEHRVEIERCSVAGSTIAIGAVSEATIRHNTLTRSEITLTGSSENIDVYNNTLLQCYNTGIDVGANNSLIYDNTIEGYGDFNYFGLVLAGYDCEVFGNEISNFYYGVVVHSTGN
ncbi:MAG: right-handed parallel beta-helix repeat-containing protein, partial [Promethearchaeota archaeon]